MQFDLLKLIYYSHKFMELLRNWKQKHETWNVKLQFPKLCIITKALSITLIFHSSNNEANDTKQSIIFSPKKSLESSLVYLVSSLMKKVFLFHFSNYYYPDKSFFFCSIERDKAPFQFVSVLSARGSQTKWLSKVIDILSRTKKKYFPVFLLTFFASIEFCYMYTLFGAIFIS